jgi:hypothetical protein
MSRAEVGADGKTGYERCKGKVAKLPGMEFGEGVLWKRRREGGPLGKLTCMWEDGIYLGMKGTTGEMIIGDKKGVWRTRTVRRKTLAERWTRDNLEMIGGVPWKMDKADGEDLKLEVTIMDKDYRERIREEAGRETVPRRMFIRKEDVEEHGYTVRCPGCVSILRGTARQEHTEVCRRRLEKELGGTDRAKQARKKVDDYVEKKMAEDEEARKKRIDEKKMKNVNVDDKTAGDHGNVVEKRKRDDGDGDGEDERANDSTSKEPDGPNVVTSGPSSFSQKREAEDVGEEKTEQFLRKLDRREKKRKEREGGQDDDEEGINEVRVAGHVVNEEVMEVTAEADQ